MEAAGHILDSLGEGIPLNESRVVPMKIEIPPAPGSATATLAASIDKGSCWTTTVCGLGALAAAAAAPSLPALIAQQVTRPGHSVGPESRRSLRSPVSLKRVQCPGGNRT